MGKDAWKTNERKLPEDEWVCVEHYNSSRDTHYSWALNLWFKADNRHIHWGH